MRRSVLSPWRRFRLRSRVLRRRLTAWRQDWLGPLVARLEKRLPGSRSVLVVERAPLSGQKGERILLAVAHPAAAEGLARYAAALGDGDAVIVISVVPPEEGRLLREQAAEGDGDLGAAALRALPALRLAVASAAEAGAATGFVVRAAEDVGQALRREARRQRARRIVLGWRPVLAADEADDVALVPALREEERDEESKGNPAVAVEREVLAPSLPRSVGWYHGCASTPSGR